MSVASSACSPTPAQHGIITLLICLKRSVLPQPVTDLTYPQTSRIAVNGEGGGAPVCVSGIRELMGAIASLFLLLLVNTFTFQQVLGAVLRLPAMASCPRKGRAKDQMSCRTRKIMQKCILLLQSHLCRLDLPVELLQLC